MIKNNNDFDNPTGSTTTGGFFNLTKRSKTAF